MPDRVVRYYKNPIPNAVMLCNSHWLESLEWRTVHNTIWFVLVFICVPNLRWLVHVCLWYKMRSHTLFEHTMLDHYRYVICCIAYAQEWIQDLCWWGMLMGQVYNQQPKAGVQGDLGMLPGKISKKFTFVFLLLVIWYSQGDGYLSGMRCKLYAYCPLMPPHHLILHWNPEWLN